MLCLMYVNSPSFTYLSARMVVSLVSCIVMMTGCVAYASCLISSFMFVVPLMFTCSMDMPDGRGVLIRL